MDKDKIGLKEIKVSAYISDNGRIVDAVTYQLDQIPSDLKLAKEDFKIHMKGKNYDIKKLTTTDDTVILLTEEFFFDGLDTFENGQFIHYDFKVISSWGELSFTKNDCILSTRIIEDFTEGTFLASNRVELSYWIYFPDGGSKLPLMVWEHGGGEVLSTSYKGANITKNKGATVWIERGKETAVLSVQYPDNYSFGISSKLTELKRMEEYNVAKYELIQQLISKGLLDASRIYISGASSGGGGVLRFIMQYPELFAAALPICAKDVLTPISEPYGLAFKMSSKILYEVLKQQGATKNKITIYTDADMQTASVPFLHGSWIVAFNNTEIIDWVYSQSK